MAENQTEKKVLMVSSSPHLAASGSSRRIMYDVAIGTLPALIMSVWLFRWSSLIVMVSCLAGALATEWAFNAVRKRPQTCLDGSAVVTALILGLSLPPSISWWAAVVGSVVAVGIGKMVFGGLGSNIFNPAMVGRAFLMASFGTMMTTWTVPVVNDADMAEPVTAVTASYGGEGAAVDAVTEPTPLGLAKQVLKDANNADKPKEEKALPTVLNGKWQDMFMGNISGSLGETSALLWLIGGIWLLIRKVITWHIPAAVLATAGAIALLVWLANPDVYPNPLVHLTGGGLMMCAFFIATDPVSCPLSRSGRVIFGIGVGALVMLIRLKGGYPEGVMYAVLLMNAVTPLLERWTRPTPVGGHSNVK